MFKVISLCLALYLTTITLIFTLSKVENFWLWPCQATSVTPNKIDLQASLIQKCYNPKAQMKKEFCFSSDLDRILTNGTANHNFPSTYCIYHTAQ